MGSAAPHPRPAVRTGMAVTSLVLGILGIPTAGCLGVGALAAIVLGIVALTRANREPLEYGGSGLAIAGIAAGAISILVAPFALGIIAAIAIPSVLRARVSANERAAIADIRAIISAEAAYHSQSGRYGQPECLAQPSRCIPGYSGPPFLDASVAALKPNDGYARFFHRGALMETAPDGSPLPHGNVTGFAVTAIPLDPYKSGVRGFCGDSSGRICSTPDGMRPDVVDAQCDPDCQDLR